MKVKLVEKQIITKNDCRFNQLDDLCVRARNLYQKFVQIPHARFIDMIKYKANQLGINVVCVEESYTSKTSFLDNEDPIKHESYKGTRTCRGLFKTAAGLKINADSNGAMQIIKKYIQYSVQNIDEIRICLQRPIRLNVS